MNRRNLVEISESRPAVLFRKLIHSCIEQCRLLLSDGKHVSSILYSKYPVGLGQLVEAILQTMHHPTTESDDIEGALVSVLVEHVLSQITRSQCNPETSSSRLCSRSRFLFQLFCDLVRVLAGVLVITSLLLLCNRAQAGVLLLPFTRPIPCPLRLGRDVFVFFVHVHFVDEGLHIEFGYIHRRLNVLLVCLSEKIFCITLHAESQVGTTLHVGIQPTSGHAAAPLFSQPVCELKRAPIRR
mmetsp:Transcript_7140/g.14475  ORF Transcript_7140/g.14475 Transcript_7140/m.14475 type:complete len:241 (-) Transcript_7140:844-1566(-)